MRTFLLFILFIAFQFGHAQRVTIIPGTSTIYPFYSTADSPRVQLVKLGLLLGKDPPKGDTIIRFDLKKFNLPDSPALVQDSVSITLKDWYSGKDTVYAYLVLKDMAIRDTLKTDQTGYIFIHSQSGQFQELRLSAMPATKAQPARPLHFSGYLDSTVTTIINPLYSPNKLQSSSDSVRLFLHIDSLAAGDTIRFKISNINFPYVPRIDTINRYYDFFVSREPLRNKDTSLLVSITKPAMDSIGNNEFFCKITAGDGKNNFGFKMLLLTERGMTPKGSSYALISLVKSISGQTAANDLFDLFIKTNIVSKEKLDSTHHISFSMIGVDASIASDTSKSVIRLSEATVNLNYGFIRYTNTTKVMWFGGGGFKVFNYNSYIGIHTGIELLDGALKESYIWAGWYYSPWINGVKSNNDTSVYRHNIYIEAAINAFGDKVPKQWQTLRLKFGLMMPMAFGSTGSGDLYPPNRYNFIYRLAVEVPLGGLLKLFD